MLLWWDYFLRDPGWSLVFVPLSLSTFRSLIFSSISAVSGLVSHHDSYIVCLRWFFPDWDRMGWKSPLFTTIWENDLWVTFSCIDSPWRPLMPPGEFLEVNIEEDGSGSGAPAADVSIGKWVESCQFQPSPFWSGQMTLEMVRWPPTGQPKSHFKSPGGFFCVCQVIQAVTFGYPQWEVTRNLWVRVRWTHHSKKGHHRNCQVYRFQQFVAPSFAIEQWKIPRLLFFSVFRVIFLIPNPWASTTIKVVVDPISIMKTLRQTMVGILTPIVLMVVGIAGELVQDLSQRNYLLFCLPATSDVLQMH